eukprot:4749696-Prymnesium_polylepis.2
MSRRARVRQPQFGSVAGPRRAYLAPADRQSVRGRRRRLGGCVARVKAQCSLVVDAEDCRRLGRDAHDEVRHEQRVCCGVEADHLLVGADLLAKRAERAVRQLRRPFGRGRAAFGWLLVGQQPRARREALQRQRQVERERVLRRGDPELRARPCTSKSASKVLVLERERRQQDVAHWAMRRLQLRQ